MINNNFKIIIDSHITVLAGYEYGKEIWDTQCSSKSVDVTQDFYLILPSQIECVASSFVHGFFETIAEKIGVKNTAERLHIIIENRRLEDHVKESLMLSVSKACQIPKD